MASSVKLELSKREISFKPRDARDFTRLESSDESDLVVTVINTTGKFASFQLELQAEGVEPASDVQWYAVEPHICAKKPPGDRTQFQVTILRSPIPAHDLKIPVIIKVLSPEIEQISTTETIFLRILRPEKTLWAYLPIQEFAVYPGDRIRIPALVHNLDSESKDISLQMGLDVPDNVQIADWFPEGIRQSRYIGAGNSEEILFWLVPPATAQTTSRVYNLTLQIDDGQGNSDSDYGKVEVLPFGVVNFDCLKPKQQAVSVTQGILGTRRCKAAFELLFENQSNVSQQIKPEIKSTRHILRTEAIPEQLNLDAELAGAVRLGVESKRPLLGTTRTRSLQVHPRLLHSQSGEAVEKVAVSPNSQTLEFTVKPILPLWLQALGGLAIVFLLWLAWWLNPRTQHTAPVSSISLFASGDTIFSGSSDQTLRRWQVNQDPWIADIRRPKFQRIITEGDAKTTTDKPIRVIHHLPEESVAQIALGLEDGKIELWNVDPPNRLDAFPKEVGPDRIFDLDFTTDSRFLFSGHGSGRVNQWDLGTDRNKPIKTLYLGANYAISAISVSERSDDEADLLIIGGQFNRLVAWDYTQDEGYNIIYKREQTSSIQPVTSRNSYITDTTTADQPSILATADNQGFITVWSLGAVRQCMIKTFTTRLNPEESFLLQPEEGILDSETCEKLIQKSLIIDQWQANTVGSPVRSVQLSNNGCYLASTGDDGRVVLWPLLRSGELDPKFGSGLVVKTFSGARLNSVDIHQTTQGQQEVILVASDTPGNRVQLYREQLDNNGCQ